MFVFNVAPLQIGDILTAVSSGNYFEIYLLAIFLSGYSFVALTSRTTHLWSDTILFEKFLIGIGIGSGFEFLWFFASVAFYSIYDPSLSLLQIFGQSAIWSCVILVAFPLMAKLNQFGEHVVRKGFYYVTAIFYYVFAFIALFFIWMIILSFTYQPLLLPYVLLATGISGTFWAMTAIIWFGFSKAYKGFFYEPPLRETVDQEKKPQGRTQTTSASDIDKLLRWRARNKVITFVFIAGLVASSFIFVDQSFHLVTSGVNSSEGVYTPMRIEPYSPTQNFIVVGQPISYARNLTSSCAMQVFAPRYENVTIKVPLIKSQLFSYLVIQNPNPADTVASNLSSFSFGGYSISKSLYANSPNVTTQTYLPSPQDVKSIRIDFINTTRPSTITLELVYFVPITSDVECTESITVINFQNNTEEFTNQYSMSNTGNSTAIIDEVNNPFVTNNALRISSFWNGSLVSDVFETSSTTAGFVTYPTNSVLPPYSIVTFGISMLTNSSNG